MKKKYIICLMAIVLAGVFCSCSNTDEDLFSDSAANRLSQSVANYENLLEESNYGWTMKFYPGETDFGGICYTADFDGRNVELRSDKSISNGTTNLVAGTEVKSMYSVKSEQGVILTFNTYNPLLHVFSQPRGTSDVDGYRSDYEFIFQRVSEGQDSIFFKGKRYSTEMVMIRLQKPAKQYISEAIYADTAIAMVPRPRMIADNKNYSIDLSNRHMNIMLGDSTISRLYVYNDNGFTLQKPIELGNKAYSNFIYDSESGDVVSADGTARIPYPTKIEQFQGTKGMWSAIFNINTDEHQMNDEMWQIYKDHYKYSSIQKITGFGIGLNQFYTAGISDYPLAINYVMDMFNGMMIQAVNYNITMEVDVDNSIVTLTPHGPTNNYLSFYRTAVVDLNNYILENSPYKVTFNEGKIATKAHFVSTKNDNIWFDLQLE